MREPYLAVSTAAPRETMTVGTRELRMAVLKVAQSVLKSAATSVGMLVVQMAARKVGPMAVTLVWMMVDS